MHVVVAIITIAMNIESNDKDTHNEMSIELFYEFTYTHGVSFLHVKIPYIVIENIVENG